MENMTQENSGAPSPLLFWNILTTLLQRFANYLKLRLSLLY